MAVAGTITVNTAEVYFNASKLAVKTRNRDAAVFKEELWQTQLVHNMIQAIKLKCIADQIPFEKRKTSPIGIDGLGKVSYRTTFCAVVLHWIGYVNVYVLASRSNELDMQNWANVQWSSTHDVLELVYVQKKTKTEWSMQYHKKNQLAMFTRTS